MDSGSTDTSNLVRINGVDVHVVFLAMNIAWIALCAAAFPLVFVACRRLFLIRTKSMNQKYHPVTVQWAHVVAVYVLLVITGLDLSHVFFDESIYITWCTLSEAILVFVSAFVFYLLTHVQTYIKSQTVLHSPGWLPKLRTAWMSVNYAVGNLTILLAYATSRAHLMSVIRIWVGLQLLAFSLVLFVIVWKLANVVKHILKKSGAADNNSSMTQRMKKFNRWSYLSSGLTLVFGIALTFSFISNLGSFDLTQRWNDDLRFSETREHKNEVAAIPYLSWGGFAIFFYCLRAFWVSKSVFSTYISTDSTIGSTLVSGTATQPSTKEFGRQNTRSNFNSGFTSGPNTRTDASGFVVRTPGTPSNGVREIAPLQSTTLEMQNHSAQNYVVASDNPHHAVAMYEENYDANNGGMVTTSDQGAFDHGHVVENDQTTAHMYQQQHGALPTEYEQASDYPIRQTV